MRAPETGEAPGALVLSPMLLRRLSARSSALGKLAFGVAASLSWCLGGRLRRAFHELALCVLAWRSGDSWHCGSCDEGECHCRGDDVLEHDPSCCVREAA